MAILRIGAFGKSHIVPAAFENDREIERLIAENPQLLVADGATPPALVARPLLLPDCALDLLFLDATSLPVVVESTLAKSDDGRRGVVARAIDAISALAEMTVPKLDEAAGGAVERALRAFAGEDGTDFGQRWTSLAVNLRAGRVRFIVAVDEVSPALERQIWFLADHSNLDVRCVAIAKSREPNGDTYYATTIMPGAGRRPPASLEWPKVTAPESPAALEPVDRAPAPRAIRLVGSNVAGPNPHRRASGQHEFLRREGALAADLLRVQWDG